MPVTPRSRTPQSRRLVLAHLERLLSPDYRSWDVAARVEQLGMLRQNNGEATPLLDEALFARVQQLGAGLLEARDIQNAMREELDKLCAPPWHFARVARLSDIEGDRRALVQCNGGLRFVNVAVTDELTGLAPGDGVYLSSEQNLVLGRLPEALMAGGETVHFDRRTEDGRLIVTLRDEEIVVEAAPSIEIDQLERGDALRWDPNAQLALEHIPRADGDRYSVEPEAELGPESVGGQEEAFAKLYGAIAASLLDPERAARFGLTGRRSVLLHGPPGCGKTLMARAIASEISRLSGRGCQVFVVRPGEWESPYVGGSQEKVRKLFENVRRAAGENGLAILFLDEADTIGHHRGGLASHHSDRFLGAWLAELDGFVATGNVAVVSATNRKDLMDGALRERLGEVEIRIGRPSRRGARQIFDIHLPEKLPLELAPGETTELVREALLDNAVSRLYAPNAEGDLATLTFRDSSQRVVHVSELVSGRLIRQICRSACEQAFLRGLECEEPEQATSGLRESDLERAISDAIENLATTLTVRSAPEYLDDLPDDLSLVRVEPRKRRVQSRARYLSPT